MGLVEFRRRLVRAVKAAWIAFKHAFWEDDPQPKQGHYPSEERAEANVSPTANSSPFESVPPAEGVPPSESAQPGPDPEPKKKENPVAAAVEKASRGCWLANATFKLAGGLVEELVVAFPVMMALGPFVPFLLKGMVGYAFLQVLKKFGIFEKIHHLLDQLKELVLNGVEVLKSEFWYLLLELYWKIHDRLHEFAFGS